LQSTNKKILVCLLLFVFIVPAIFSQSGEQVKVGSKKFTENVILGEIATQLIRVQNIDAVHIRELGGTRILWNALLKGDIDVYPDYTGTIIEEILANEDVTNDNLKEKLAQHGIGIIYPLGFNNTYAIGMKKEDEAKLSIEKISDLRNYPDLKFGFTNEFMDRKDGWRGLQKFYNLPQTNVNGLDHDLAYRGLAGGSIDVIDLYSTDAEISYYNLKVLKDDSHYFTDYQAVLLYRKDLEKYYPEVVEALKRLINSIPESLMIKMNSDVKINGLSEEKVAVQFIKDKFSIEPNYTESTFLNRLWHNTKEHFFLVLISLSAAILVSIPLGIFSYKNKKLGKVILGVTGIIQTIPSLALLVFMIPLLGIGSGPAICALFLYSLLPIVRNTHSGLEDIPLSIKESAIVLGLSSSAILRKIELPLASRSILAGIKTSAVINVGTATLGALIGAGGYGQPILTGIRLDSVPLILEGAVPAALLALMVQWIFDLSEKVIVPRGLRI
jgi:glycine betaine/choline ABC-type transport system substrate-binding protein/ABC-type proline/glycine betaine transport system permease subunit